MSGSSSRYARPRGEDGKWVLVHGTVLLVPEECANQSWARQRSAREGFKPLHLPPELALEGEEWLLARQLISVEEADALLEIAFGLIGSEGELPGTGALPEITTSLESPDLWRRVMPQTDTPTASLLAGLHRPVGGIFLPAPSAPAFKPPRQVEVEGTWSHLPSVEIAGIHVTPDEIAPELATAKGLLVGRGERRAWLGESRGRGDFNRFNAEVCADRDLIDVDDLELTHNEYRDGDLALSNRFKLVDGETSGETVIASIPTIGRSVAHELILQTSSGELLDRSGPYPLVEKIEITVSIDGGEGTSITSGVSGPPPGLDERVIRARAVQSEIREERKRSAQGSIVQSRSDGMARVAALLSRARGELMVIDPFFGQHREEWALLGELTVPTRVVSAKVETDSDQVPVPVKLPTNVEARYRRKAPIHDRVYVWQGGGFWLGASLSTLGQAPVGIGMLSEDEAGLWSEIFEALWESPYLRPVPQPGGG